MTYLKNWCIGIIITLLPFFIWNVTIWLVMKWSHDYKRANAFFWSFIGVWKRWPKYIFNEAENVVRSTLSYSNETSKECIQFL
jgi:hypothetical protein